jgi:uncharacterized cupredoxin-like copper-binding protein
MSKAFIKVIATVALSIALVACSTAGTSTTPSSAASATAMPGASGDAVEVGALGQPADAASADRTIRITASDQLKFDPDAVEVKVLETVTFEIVNTGATDHEFVLGSPAYQAKHEQEMQAGTAEMGDETNAVDVPAGTTQSITWQFTTAGATRFACHQPGHFAAGMVGDVTVTR